VVGASLLASARVWSINDPNVTPSSSSKLWGCAIVPSTCCMSSTSYVPILNPSSLQLFCSLVSQVMAASPSVVAPRSCNRSVSRSLTVRERRDGALASGRTSAFSLMNRLGNWVVCSYLFVPALPHVLVSCANSNPICVAHVSFTCESSDRPNNTAQGAALAKLLNRAKRTRPLSFRIKFAEFSPMEQASEQVSGRCLGGALRYVDAHVRRTYIPGPRDCR
jgi:hypothetical protein